MTDTEAVRLLDEHRAVRPRFVRRGHRYTVRPDGRVDIERAVGNSGRRWAFKLTVPSDSYALPSDVRRRVSS